MELMNRMKEGKYGIEPPIEEGEEEMEYEDNIENVDNVFVSDLNKYNENDEDQDEDYEDIMDMDIDMNVDDEEDDIEDIGNKTKSTAYSNKTSKTSNDKDSSKLLNKKRPLKKKRNIEYDYVEDDVNTNMLKQYNH